MNDSIMYNKIREIVKEYKKDFQRVNSEERYKWEAIEWYKQKWDIDADDFAEMLGEAFKKSANLLAAAMYYPLRMILKYAKEEPETVRELFRILYNENILFAERYEVFRAGFAKYVSGKKLNHYQDLRAISVYLTFEYPEKYYMYKYKMYNSFKEKIMYFEKTANKSDIEKYDNYLELCNMVLEVVKQDIELQELSKSRLDNSCYADDAFHILTHDIIYFGSKIENKVDTEGYWPSLEEYDPDLTSEDWKRFILEVEKPNHLSPMIMLKCLMASDGKSSCKQLAQNYGGTASAYIGCAVNLGKRAKKFFDLPPCMREGQERYYPIPFLGKEIEEDGKKEYIYKIRPELFEALKEIDLSDIPLQYADNKEEISMTDVSLNTILYGPPGTGKTYNTVVYAVAIIENKTLQSVKEEEYAEVFERYNHYKADGLIEFTTFHQSYGYEEFIEGIKPVMEASEDDSTDIQYEIASGMFKSFCERAGRPVFKQEKADMGLNGAPTIWKVSLEGTGENPTRTECMNNGHIRIGWDSYGESITSDTMFEKGGKAILNAFIYKMKVGDIVLSCYSATTIDAIGVVTGEYEWHDEYEHYKRLRKVNWIVKDIREDIIGINNGTTLTLSSVYKLNISLSDVMDIVAKNAPSFNSVEDKKNHVFVIDEINRGNISKIFGELITLIEHSKRIGQPEGMKAKLPYSQQPFGIPNNVYIIGTMNTADRSIATIDTALRRRFRFKEMLPDPSVLEGIYVEDVSVREMLEKMNRRISVLYDREHTLGHAYFVPLKTTPTLEVLGSIFADNIIPLLQEYFYEDYEKIRMVLGDNNKSNVGEQFVKVVECDFSDLFGAVEYEFDDARTYEINQEAFNNIEAYKKI